MVTSDAYLQELLRRYQANFDVTENYKFGEILFPAYAFFHSMSEKYVLRKEAQLWAVKTFEHVFFIKETSFSPEKEVFSSPRFSPVIFFRKITPERRTRA